MARYIQQPQQQYVSQYVPKDLNFYQQQIDKAQNRYDTTQAMYSEALGALGEMEAYDQDTKNEIIKGLTEDFDKTYNKYQGDLSKATGDVMGIVSKTRSNPLLSGLKEQLIQGRTLEKQLAANPNLIVINDPRTKSVKDLGSFTELQPVTINPREVNTLFLEMNKAKLNKAVESAPKKDPITGLFYTETTKGLTDAEINEMLQDENTYNSIIEQFPQLAGRENDPFVQQTVRSIVAQSASQFKQGVTKSPFFQGDPTTTNREDNTTSPAFPTPRGKQLNIDVSEEIKKESKELNRTVEKIEEGIQKIEKFNPLFDFFASNNIKGIEELENNILELYSSVSNKNIKSLKKIPEDFIYDIYNNNPKLYSTILGIYKNISPDEYYSSLINQNSNGDYYLEGNFSYNKDIFEEVQEYLTDSKETISNLETNLIKNPILSSAISQGASTSQAAQATQQFLQTTRAASPTTYNLNSEETEEFLIDDIMKTAGGLMITPLEADSESGALRKNSPIRITDLDKDNPITGLTYTPASGSFIGYDSKGGSYEIDGNNLSEVTKDWVSVGKQVFDKASGKNTDLQPVISKYAIPIPKANLDAFVGKDTGDMYKNIRIKYDVDYVWNKETNTIVPQITPSLFNPQSNTSLPLDPVSLDELSNEIMDNLILTYSNNSTKKQGKF